MDKARLEELKTWVKQMQKFGVSEGKDLLALIDAALTEPSKPAEHGIVAKECIEKYKADPQKAIEQIEWCGYECEGGTIEKNLAWEAIKELLAEPDADVADMSNDDIDWLIAYIDGGFGETWQWNKSKRNVLVAALRQYQKPTGETSDGYHTFNELYHHRAILFAALSKAYPDKAWKSLKHHDGTMFDDETFVCGIKTPEGHYTYHYNTRYWPMFTGKILENAPEWDGHKPEDVDRLLTLRQMGSTKPTDEAVQRAIGDLLDMKEHWCADSTDNDAISIDIAITALRQYQKPTDAKIIQATEWIESYRTVEEKDWQDQDPEWRQEPGAQDYYHDMMQAFDLAIQGLRQMRSEPCEWCDGNNHKWLSVEPHAIGFEVYPDDYHKHCPNCGRPLKGGE